MIFNFLRKYLKDDEFEQTKTELAETRQVLKEYKEFLTQIQNMNINDEAEKVEPDFLTLMWASVGVAIAIFIDVAQKTTELKDHMNEPQLYVWIALGLFSLYFIVANGINTIKLTKKYVESKQDPIYRNYAWYLKTGVILLVLATVMLAILNPVAAP